MPGWASRIDLLVKSVRVERLQDINQDDVIKEGAMPYALPCMPEDKTPCKTWFRKRWSEINDHRPGCRWADNPYVRVIEFERIEP